MAAVSPYSFAPCKGPSLRVSTDGVAKVQRNRPRDHMHRTSYHSEKYVGETEFF